MTPSMIGEMCKACSFQFRLGLEHAPGATIFRSPSAIVSRPAFFKLSSCRVRFLPESSPFAASALRRYASCKPPGRHRLQFAKIAPAHFAKPARRQFKTAAQSRPAYGLLIFLYQKDV